MFVCCVFFPLVICIVDTLPALTCTRKPKSQTQLTFLVWPAQPDDFLDTIFFKVWGLGGVDNVVGGTHACGGQGGGGCFLSCRPHPGSSLLLIVVKTSGSFFTSLFVF